MRTVKNILVAVAIVIGMLSAFIVMSAQPSQAYAPPGVIHVVVEHKTLYGIHQVPFARKCWVSVNHGVVVHKYCHRWHQTGFSNAGFGGRF